MNDDLTPAIPAATLILFRDDLPGRPPQLLFVERSQAMTFAAGALVFPGGRVDEGDRALAARLGGDDPDETAARIAAIRETIEEVGLAVGVRPLPCPAAIETMRTRLASGTPIAEALAAARLMLDLSVLTPFARWRPAHRHLRIYDTRFYLAQLPHGAPLPAVDATENVRLFWASADAVLAAVTSSSATVIFPTRRTLERLARYADFAAGVADAGRYPMTVVTPWIERRDGVDHLCIPDHLGYPITAEPLADAMRG